MYASVTLRDGLGAAHELVPGDIIGRVWSAALLIDDGRVSEAHAMISLREGELQLIALRGGFAVSGRPVNRLTLTPGVVVQLARGVELAVEAVRLPEAVLGVEGPGMPRQVLPAVCSILIEAARMDGAPTTTRLAPGWRDDAVARLWSRGDAWRLQIDEAITEVEAGQTISVREHTLRLVAMPIASAGFEATRRADELEAPLTVIAQYDTVHVLRGDRVAVVLPGKQAQLISELVACGGPVGWMVLTDVLWPNTDEATRRSRVDVLLSKLRRRLRVAGVREDLIRADGAGHLEVFLHGNDSLVDRT